MAITIQHLKDKHTKANIALDSHGLKLADKLATGNTHPSMIQKFNLMSAWISFLNGKLVVPKNIVGASPGNVQIDIPIVVGLTPITVGIENNSGRYVPIFSIYNYLGTNALVSVNELDSYFLEKLEASGSNLSTYTRYIDEQNIDRGNFSVLVLNESTIIINFPKTSDFNGQRLLGSSSITNFNNNIEVSKGVNKGESSSYLDEETKKKYNKILENIAIELKISY
tara:strand:+ start:1868 stop:2542 length:675 start_codon:yes stop_codon:yes gene_type:complete